MAHLGSLSLSIPQDEATAIRRWLDERSRALGFVSARGPNAHGGHLAARLKAEYDGEVIAIGEKSPISDIVAAAWLAGFTVTDIESGIKVEIP
jgi:hypothetical protein